MILLPFNEYQKQAIKFDRYVSDEIWPFALGLAGEAGEAVEKIKKAYRVGAPPLDKEGLAYELGDVLWYLSAMAGWVGYSLEDIAVMNIKKLQDREDRKKIVGEGDKR